MSGFRFVRVSACWLRSQLPHSFHVDYKSPMLVFFFPPRSSFPHPSTYLCHAPSQVQPRLNPNVLLSLFYSSSHLQQHFSTSLLQRFSSAQPLILRSARNIAARVVISLHLSRSYIEANFSICSLFVRLPRLTLCYAVETKCSPLDP